MVETSGEDTAEIDGRTEGETPGAKTDGRDPRNQPVSVYGLCWVGTQTSDFDKACEFYEEVLGLHIVHRCDQDHSIFQTDNGDFVVVHGPESPAAGRFETGPLVGMRVDDIEAARARMERKGVEFLTPIVVKDDGRWKFAHYRGPDGNLYEIVEEDYSFDRDESWNFYWGDED